MAVLHGGAVTSGHVASSVALMLRVMAGLAFTIKLPSVAATSHRVVHNVMEPLLFAPPEPGSCTIHWVGVLGLPPVSWGGGPKLAGRAGVRGAGPRTHTSTASGWLEEAAHIHPRPIPAL